MILHSNVIGNGRPFFILHGFLGMGDNWKTLAKKIAQKGFEVHLIDARNHGRSFHDDKFSYEIMVTDLLNYCTSKGIEKCTLLGHSMGGKTAMLYAVMNPEFISKLIVVDIAPRYYPIHHTEILNGLACLKKKKLTSRSKADEILSDFVDDYGTRQFLLKNLYWTENKTLDLRVNLNVLNDNVAEVGEALPNTAEFTGDTLFLKGDKSEYISVSDEFDIKKHFPNAIIETINNAGHWLHAENPDDFLHKLFVFI